MPPDPIYDPPEKLGAQYAYECGRKDERGTFRTELVLTRIVAALGIFVGALYFIRGC